MNELVRTQGLLDLDLIEKVLEARKRERVLAQRRMQIK